MTRPGLGVLVLLALTIGACTPLPGQWPTPTPPPAAPPTPRPGAEGAAGVEPAPAAPFRLDGEPSVEVGLEWNADTLQLATARRQLTWRIGRAHDLADGRVPRVAEQ